MKSTHLFNNFITRSDMKMVSITQNNLCFQMLQILRLKLHLSLLQLLQHS